MRHLEPILAAFVLASALGCSGGEASDPGSLPAGNSRALAAFYVGQFECDVMDADEATLQLNSGSSVDLWFLSSDGHEHLLEQSARKADDAGVRVESSFYYADDKEMLELVLDLALQNDGRLAGGGTLTRESGDTEACRGEFDPAD